jgi:hypothetical protein
MNQYNNETEIACKKLSKEEITHKKVVQKKITKQNTEKERVKHITEKERVPTNYRKRHLCSGVQRLQRLQMSLQ